MGHSFAEVISPIMLLVLHTGDIYSVYIRVGRRSLRGSHSHTVRSCSTYTVSMQFALTAFGDANMIVASAFHTRISLAVPFTQAKGLGGDYI